MTNIFDFLTDLAPYSEDEFAIARLQARHRLIIDPFLPQIEDARILDLACHDGRWSFALAAVGAREIIGVEARQNLIDRFALFPNTPFKKNISLRCGDLYEQIEQLVERKEKFNIVAIYGIFYHILDHFRLLSLVRKLCPQLIIIDSEFIVADNAMIQVLKEDVSKPLNAISAVDGVQQTVVGVPSRRATEFMADALALDITWLDPNLILNTNERMGMKDYFRDGRKVRGTCVLSPRLCE